MQVRMEEEGWNNGLSGRTELGWNNGLSGGDIAAVVLYFILVLGIGLYVCPITFSHLFLLDSKSIHQEYVKLSLTLSHYHHHPQQHYDDDNDEAELQSMMRPNRDTIEGYFLAGKHMFWLPVSAPAHNEDGDTDKMMMNTCQ